MNFNNFKNYFWDNIIVFFLPSLSSLKTLPFILLMVVTFVYVYIIIIIGSLLLQRKHDPSGVQCCNQSQENQAHMWFDLVCCGTQFCKAHLQFDLSSQVMAHSTLSQVREIRGFVPRVLKEMERKENLVTPGGAMNLVTNPVGAGNGEWDCLKHHWTVFIYKVQKSPRQW